MCVLSDFAILCQLFGELLLEIEGPLTTSPQSAGRRSSLNISTLNDNIYAIVCEYIIYVCTFVCVRVRASWAIIKRICIDVKRPG